ncbi:MAG: hypothetical protein NC331_10315 [Lachnospiraceae bacterium]|nr:hypothetical protein [Lachnospiraceae bacterium]MCM1239765.1 hypothetical protein [Lachnospiraceae bacterium]
MNCLWIILLLSCFGGCGWNQGGGRGSDRCCDDNGGCSGGGQRNRCRRAVDNAVDECGSERAVMRTLNERDRDCDCGSEKPGCPEAREERGGRMADNNSCDVPNMNPPRWQDFPEVSRSSSHDDCGCDAQ